MAEENTTTPTKTRSIGISIGMTEGIYLVGLGLLAAGVGLQFGLPAALITAGMVLLFTAFRNDAEREQGTS